MQSSTNANKQVIICDDEIMVLQTIKEMLSGQPLDIKTYEDGQKALAEILKSPPDLIISDIYMPHMTGIQLLRALHDMQVKIPVIFLTASLEQEDYNEAYAFGRFEYLNKPVSVDDLINTIDKALLFGYQEGPGDKFKAKLLSTKVDDF